ncbi:DUF2188 domain-containing protein [Metabacillus arenae]|uniref:DUF2188 domain-containing protein n=1 Tax=Metabacillus arenae TaxID=2771434 RepID=A0A926NCI4_9BACI|nr:DUF2188 domain-containing protein [Metabacillus arenae]MBD1379029.1 DUF2188 domain-containing protein [Metabacillus arenae]
MSWTKNDYPSSFKNLPSKTKNKAIDIGNSLLDEGYEEDRAIPIAISQAEKWADNQSGSTKEEYVVFYKEDKWVLKKQGNKRPTNTFTTKEAAMDKGREFMKNRNITLIVEKQDGSIQQRINDN